MTSSRMNSDKDGIIKSEISIPGSVGLAVIEGLRATIAELKAESNAEVRIDRKNNAVGVATSNIVISAHNKTSMTKAERMILEHLSRSQNELEFLYSDVVVSVLESWSDETMAVFEKCTRTTLAICTTKGGKFVLIRGWDKSSLTFTKSTLIGMSGVAAIPTNYTCDNSTKSDSKNRYEHSVHVPGYCFLQSGNAKFEELERNCAVSITRSTEVVCDKANTKRTKFTVSASEKSAVDKAVAELTQLLGPLSVTVKNSDSSRRNPSKKMQDNKKADISKSNSTRRNDKGSLTESKHNATVHASRVFNASEKTGTGNLSKNQRGGRGANRNATDSKNILLDINGKPAPLKQSRNRTRRRDNAMDSEPIETPIPEDIDDEESATATSSDEDDDHAKYPACMNILVLGETGVGKSTFINGLVNYLKYGSMEDALGGGVEILIKSTFTLTDDNFESRKIVTESTVPDEQGSRDNECHGDGESATQDPKSYVFTWTTDGEQKSIRIIDTPGIGDTRGVDQDKKNFDKILSFIADFDELHAVCVLIKPNTARLTLQFRFCVDELLMHLHRSASDNIVFCFTNTRGTLYKPGDTLPTLKEHLSRLQKTRGITIPMDRTTLFSFDNESFRFLCACQDGFPFSKKEKKNFGGSWTKSVEESCRLFARISELPVHKVNDTLCLNNTRSVILSLARPLAELSKNQMINRKLIQDKLKEIEQHNKAGDDLRRRLYVNQVVMQTQELLEPQTVCTAADCVSHAPFSAEPGAPLRTVYKTVCHPGCLCARNVKVETCPSVELQRCWAMQLEGDRRGLNCRICGCLWSFHMHIRYKIIRTMVKVVDPTVENSIKNKDSAVASINLFLFNLRNKLARMESESTTISHYCAEFASFLRKNSILPYNDSYGHYVEHLIREERDKVSGGESDELLKKLEQYKSEYEQQVRLIDSPRPGKGRSRSVEEMDMMIKELQQMEHCGPLLEEIKRLELMSVRRAQVHSSKHVNVDGWLSRVKNSTKNIAGR